MREGKLHYKVQIRSNVWRRHSDQITNVGSEISFLNDTNSEESCTGIFRRENVTLKQDDSPSFHSCIADLELINSHPGPTLTDFHDPDSL